MLVCWGWPCGFMAQLVKIGLFVRSHSRELWLHRSCQAQRTKDLRPQPFSQLNHTPLYSGRVSVERFHHSHPTAPQKDTWMLDKGGDLSWPEKPSILPSFHPSPPAVHWFGPVYICFRGFYYSNHLCMQFTSPPRPGKLNLHIVMPFWNIHLGCTMKW